jgi:hypothetical protein
MLGNIQGNQFIIEVLADGKLKITAPGGFSPEVHADADELLALAVSLMGGPCETKQNLPTLGLSQHVAGGLHHHGDGKWHKH